MDTALEIMIEQGLGSKFIRIHPDKEKSDIFRAINEIFRQINNRLKKNNNKQNFYKIIRIRV